MKVDIFDSNTLSGMRIKQAPVPNLEKAEKLMLVATPSSLELDQKNTGST